MNFDFSTWDRKVSSSDLRDYYRSQGIPFNRRPVFLITLAFLGIAVLWAFDVWVAPRMFSNPEYSSLLPSVVGGTVMAALLIIYTVWWWAGMLRRNVLLAKFCQANGLNFRELAKDYAPGGAPFVRQQNSITRPVVSTEDFTLVIGRHQVLNSGDQVREQLHRPFTFAMSRLPRSVPHLILKNRHSRILRLSQAANVVKLQLEGNFADTFTLYCPPGYERDALYIFTPEVMAACLDLAGNAEIELVDDNLFLYTRSPAALQEPAELAAFFGLVQRLTARFEKQTDAYSDERVLDPSQVAGGARRLNLNGRRWVPFLISAGLAVVAFGLSYFFLIFPG
ncbi:MAG: hypothetical protein LBK28_06390 [Propionibacteriaceae bacterium]|jgi:hypothetical protein|nr:hypothetical protein [Propionibacteriaceae bacterium]